MKLITDAGLQTIKILQELVDATLETMDRLLLGVLEAGKEIPLEDLQELVDALPNGQHKQSLSILLHHVTVRALEEEAATEARNEADEHHRQHGYH